MVSQEFLEITLQLANFGIGLVLWSIAIDLWVHRTDERMALYIIAAYAMAGATFLIVSVLGASDLSVIHVIARLIRKIVVLYLALIIYSYLKDGHEPLFKR